MAGEPLPSAKRRSVNEHSIALAHEWRRLGRAATVVALFTSPISFTLLYTNDWGLLWSLVGAFAGVVLFRALIDVVAHRFIPSPSIYGAEKELQQEDVVTRRRLWYWRKKFRRFTWLVVIVGVAIAAGMIYQSLSGGDASVGGGLDAVLTVITTYAPIAFMYAPILVMLFLINFLILFGPMILLGAGQIKTYEPGDANWGVKLEDVRGQAEAKQEITRVVSLWQSGEEFVKAGGKRERGVLFLGAARARARRCSPRASRPRSTARS